MEDYHRQTRHTRASVRSTTRSSLISLKPKIRFSIPRPLAADREIRLPNSAATASGSGDTSKKMSSEKSRKSFSQHVITGRYQFSAVDFVASRSLTCCSSCGHCYITTGSLRLLMASINKNFLVGVAVYEGFGLHFKNFISNISLDSACFSFTRDAIS